MKKIDFMGYTKKENLEWIKRNPDYFDDALFITHNENKVFIQGWGMSINLYEDGTWVLEDTTGG